MRLKRWHRCFGIEPASMIAVMWGKWSFVFLQCGLRWSWTLSRTRSKKSHACVPLMSWVKFQILEKWSKKSPNTMIFVAVSHSCTLGSSGPNLLRSWHFSQKMLNFRLPGAQWIIQKTLSIRLRNCNICIRTGVLNSYGYQALLDGQIWRKLCAPFSSLKTYRLVQLLAQSIALPTTFKWNCWTQPKLQ